MENFYINLELYQLQQLLNRLSIPYSIDRVNKNIVHLKIFKGSEVFRLRFINEYGIYRFTAFLEG